MVGLLLAAGCYDPVYEGGGSGVPIVSEDTCTGCHASGAGEAFADLDLTLGENAIVGVSSTGQPDLPLVTPGSPEESYLYLKVTGAHLEAGGSGDAMPPPGGGLDDASIGRIFDWITDLPSSGTALP